MLMEYTDRPFIQLIEIFLQHATEIYLSIKDEIAFLQVSLPAGFGSFSLDSPEFSDSKMFCLRISLTAKSKLIVFMSKLHLVVMKILSISFPYYSINIYETV